MSSDTLHDATDALPPDESSGDLLPLDRLMVDLAGAAALLSISKRHLRSLDNAGKMPAPVRLGRSVRWSVEELRAWLRAGCPSRERWEILRQRFLDLRTN